MKDLRGHTRRKPRGERGVRVRELPGGQWQVEDTTSVPERAVGAAVLLDDEQNELVLVVPRWPWGAIDLETDPPTVAIAAKEIPLAAVHFSGEWTVALEASLQVDGGDAPVTLDDATLFTGYVLRLTPGLTVSTMDPRPVAEAGGSVTVRVVQGWLLEGRILPLPGGDS